jgi:hypothetical protein
MDSKKPEETEPEKTQPWKAIWLARTSSKGPGSDDKSRSVREGTSHGFSKGQEVILDGTTTGMASRAHGKR